MSMDPSVIEIQTAPASGEDFSAGFIGQIVRTIYKRAAGREFSPGGGGGHINVDFKTGFNEDPSLIPKVLVATEIVIAKLKDTESESYAQLVDAGNELEDPFIGTKRVKMSTNRSGGWDVSHLPDDKDEGDYSGTWRRDVLEKVKVKSMKNLEAFREAHALWLHTHPTLSQQKGATEQTGKLTEKADKEGLNATLHYQAVNIDHLFDKVIKDEESDKVEDPRRLEFRFFKGQRDLDDIIAGMELISRIVKEAGKL